MQVLFVKMLMLWKMTILLSKYSPFLKILITNTLFVFANLSARYRKMVWKWGNGLELRIVVLIALTGL